MIKPITAKLGLAETDTRLGAHALSYWLLSVITVAGAVLRFHKLGEWSFWGDEISSVLGVADGFNDSVIRGSSALALIRLSAALLGTSEWSARLVPALIGVISLPVLFFPVRRLFGSAVALLATLLLAISPWHLYWSQNARFYSLLLLFYTLALLLFHLGLEGDRADLLLLSFAFLGLAMRERLIALVFLPVILSYLLLLRLLPWEKPPGFRLRSLSLFFVPGGLLALFFALPYVQHFSIWLAGFGQANNSPLWLLAGVVYYVRLSTLCVAACGALYLFSQRSRAGLLLALGAVVPLVVLLTLSPFHYTANRYLFVTLPCWIILASRAVVELVRLTRSQPSLLVMAALLILVLDPLSEDILYYKYQQGNRDNFKAAFELVQREKQADDLVVVSPHEVGDYYLKQPTIGMERVDLAEVATQGRRVWFVEDMNVEYQWPPVLDWLQQNARLMANFDVAVQARNFKMRVYLYSGEGRGE